MPINLSNISCALLYVGIVLGTVAPHPVEDMEFRHGIEVSVLITLGPGGVEHRKVWLTVP